LSLPESYPAAARLTRAAAVCPCRLPVAVDLDLLLANVLMHQTLREMPGPRSEMTAVISHWDPATHQVRIANCAHVAPLILRASGEAEHLDFPKARGLGGRAIAAAARSERATAADTVRKIHMAVLDQSGDDLDDDATAVCLSVA